MKKSSYSEWEELFNESLKQLIQNNLNVVPSVNKKGVNLPL